MNEPRIILARTICALGLIVLYVLFGGGVYLSVREYGLFIVLEALPYAVVISLATVALFGFEFAFIWALMEMDYHKRRKEIDDRYQSK